MGNWVGRQRQAYKKNELSEERVGKLEALGFDWNPLGTQLTWDERFAELVEYKNKHGDCSVPKRLKGRNWVDYQRKARKLGRLSSERVGKLEALGFNFGRGVMSRPRCNAGVTGEGEGDRGRQRKRHPASANDAGAESSWTENDDEVDEIGALIYDQVMQRSMARPARYSVAFEVACPSQSGTMETESTVADVPRPQL